MKETMKIKCRSLDKGKSCLDTIAESLNSAKESPFVVVIAPQANGQLLAYFEDPVPEKCIGLVKGDNDNISTIINYDYKCRITAIDGTEMEAYIETTTEEPVATTSAATSVDVADFPSEETAAMFGRIMADHKISKKIQDKIIADRKARGVNSDVTPLSTPYVNTGEFSNPKDGNFYNAILSVLARCAFVLEGPKSVGKNVFCKTLAHIFGFEYFVIQLNENTSDGDVYGEKSTDNSAAKAITMEMALAKTAVDTALATGKSVDEKTLKLASEFEYYKSLAASVKIEQALGVWVQWLQRGGLMCLNEMDMADANFFSMLVNMILDGTGFMTVPGYGRVDVNPNCVLIGTQNGSEYAGTNGQNAASISRFDVYRLSQPKDVLNTLKTACKGEGFEIEDKYIIACNEFYKDLIKKCSMEGFDGVISDTALNIRGMVRALKAVFVSDYEVSLKKRLQLSVVNACAEDERPLVMQALNEKVAC